MLKGGLYGKMTGQKTKYLSFLSRKEKFLKYDNFVMIFFNYDLSKFVRIKKSDILKFPSVKRYTKGKYDLIRKIPFECGKMYGKGFGEREKSIFKHEVCYLKNVWQRFIINKMVWKHFPNVLVGSECFW